MTEVKIALSIEEAADYTGIGRNTLRKLVEWKKLTPLNLGSLRFVGMNLGFLLGVNDHRFVINLSNFQFSHLLL